MYSKGKKLFKDFGVILLGSFGSKILSFLMIPLYTSILSTSDYGIIDLINTSVSFMYPIVTLSISEALVRFVLEKDGNDDAYLTTSLLIFLMGSALMIPGSWILSLFLFNGKYYFYILGVFVMTSASTILGQYARGTECLKVYSISGVITTFVFLFLNIFFLVVLKIGLKGYLLSSIISLLVSVMYLIIRLEVFQHLSLKKGIDKVVINKMISYSIPLIFNSISWWVVISSDKYILLHFYGTSINGIYSVAQKIPSLLMTIVTLFISAWQISSVDNFGSEESEKFFSSVLKKYQGILVLIATIMIPFVNLIAKLMFAKDFYIAWKYVFVLLLANIFYSIESFQGTVYTAAMRTKASCYTTLAGAVCNVVLNLLLIPDFGIMGACIATASSYYLVMIIRQIDINRFFNLKVHLLRNHVEYSILLTQGMMMLTGKFVFQVLAVLLIIPVLYMERTFISEAFAMIKGRMNV